MLRQTNQQPITALCPRLSHEDELQGEQFHFNQKRIRPETYAKQNGFSICAGTRTTVILVRTFKDPVSKPCFADIEAGKVGTVIVKDMSRLGETNTWWECIRK